MDLGTEATGLEPATSGVTGDPGAFAQVAVTAKALLAKGSRRFGANRESRRISSFSHRLDALWTHAGASG